MDASNPKGNKGNLNDTKQDRESLKKEAEKMFVKELRERVDHYFRITVRTLRVHSFAYSLGNYPKKYWDLFSA
jgi:hypothetical protein